jgi:hypothetical protein
MKTVRSLHPLRTQSASTHDFGLDPGSRMPSLASGKTIHGLDRRGHVQTAAYRPSQNTPTGRHAFHAALSGLGGEGIPAQPTTPCATPRRSPTPAIQHPPRIDTTST